MKKFAAALLASTALALALPAYGQSVVADSAKAVTGMSSLGLYPFGGMPGLGYFDGTSAKPKAVPFAPVELPAFGGDVSCPANQAGVTSVVCSIVKIGGKAPAPSATVDTTNGDNIPSLNFTHQWTPNYIPTLSFSQYQQSFQTSDGATWVRGAGITNGPPTVYDAGGNPWHIKITTEVDPRWASNFTSTGTVSTYTGSGALGDYSANDLAPFQRAALWANAYGVPLHVRRGNYVLDGGQVLLKTAPLHADGSDAVQFFTHGYAGSLLVADTTSAQISGQLYGGFKCTNGAAAGDATFATSACVEITGPNQFVFNKLIDIVYQGFKYGENDTIANGQYNYNFHDFTTVQPEANNPLWAQWMQNGSGTSNIWTHQNGNFGGGARSTQSAYLRVDGTTAGDLNLSVSELDGAYSLLSVGNNVTVYFDNISLSVDQFDGVMICPLSIDAGGSGLVPNGIHIAGSNIGGGVNLYTCLGRPIASSIVHDRGASEWLAGNSLTFNATGMIAVNLFQLDLSVYSGTTVDVALEGSVPNIGAVSARYSCAIALNGSAGASRCTPTIFANADGTTSAPELTLTTTTTGTTALFTANETASGAAGPGRISGSIRGTNGTFRIKRCVPSVNPSPASAC